MYFPSGKSEKARAYEYWCIFKSSISKPGAMKEEKEKRRGVWKTEGKKLPYPAIDILDAVKSFAEG